MPQPPAPDLDLAAPSAPRRPHPAVRVTLGFYWLVLIVATHWPNLTKEDVPDFGWLPFDKVMHVLTFAGLAALLTWAKPLSRRSVKANAFAAVAIGLAYGVFEELTQPYFGRTRDLADLVADLLGLIAGAGFALGFSTWLASRPTTRRAPRAAVGSTETPQTDSEPDLTAATENPTAISGEISGGTSGGAFGGTSGGGFVGHATLVAALTLVSRMTGLVRDAVLAAIFGASLTLDAFFIGFLVPNLFRRLFGEGALTAAFIPRYTKLLHQDPALAKRFASLCVIVVAVLLAAITLVGELVLWGVLSRTAGEKAGTALRLTMMMLPYMPMVCGVAFLGAILQVHRKFGPPAAAPVLLNLTMIAAAMIVGWRTDGAWSSVTVVAMSVLLAGVIQLLWMGFSVWRVAPLTSAFHGTRSTFRDMLLTMLPMVIGLAVFQINTLFDGLIAYTLSPPELSPGSILPQASLAASDSAAGQLASAAQTFTVFGHALRYPLEPGSVTTLTLAQRLYQFPLGVFGIAIATAIFPALATAVAKRSTTKAKAEATQNHASQADLPENTPAENSGEVSGGGGEFAEIFRRGLRLTLFIGLPASVGLILVRVPLTRVFFEWKNFGTDDALRCAAVLAGYASAVWAYSMTHVITRAYYAVDDAITPLKITGGMVGFNLALNLTLIWPFGVAGLAWSTAISATAQVGLLLWFLRKHIHRPIDRDVLTGTLRVLGLTAVMGGAVWAAMSGFDTTTLSKAGSAGVLALGVGVGAVVVFGGAWLARLPEARWLLRR